MTAAGRSAVDDLDLTVPLPSSVGRVVSLVPSLTESLALTTPGLLVGATDWCSYPADLDVVRVGGTKNPDLAAIGALRPDLVVGNAEENRPADLAALREAGLAVWVTDIRTVPAALTSLRRLLVEACGGDEPDWLHDAQAAWDFPVRAPTRRAVIPIWRRPWMALGADTFAGDVLARLGVSNVLADAPERYPRIDPGDLPAIDLAVLPDEPYAFSPTDGPEAFAVPAACVSGRHLTWYGPSMVEAPTLLAEQLAASVQL